MILTNEELVGLLQREVNIILHLISKADEADLDYRPTPKQRSLRELIAYLSIFAPIVLETIRLGVLDMGAWRQAWGSAEAASKQRSVPENVAVIAAAPEMFSRVIGAFTEEDLRMKMEMFGATRSRGELLVWMLASHYAAYRMQLFLYLKSCGHAELSTMNAWAGVDPPPAS